MRWRSLLPAAFLATLALAGAAPAASDASARPRGKAPRLHGAIANRVAVTRSPSSRPQPRNRRDILTASPGPLGPRPPAPTSPSATAPPPPPPPPTTGCTLVVADLPAAEAAIATAPAEAVICLADGSYGQLSASGSAEVTLRAEHAGQAALAGASLAGAHLTLAGFEITDEVTVQPGSTAITIAHNRISGGYFGIDAGPTSTTTIDDTAIIGNELIGPFGEDAIHLNRYHDADGDGVGILIEGNEITNVRENGNHSDCLQTVWVGDHIVFRENYLHDNRCQGFFVNDQASPGEASGPIVGIAVENNLFLRNDAPCASAAPDCGEPSYFHVFGPYSEMTMRRNTIWGGEPVASFQDGAGDDTRVESNVVYRFWTATDLTRIAYADNTRCERDLGTGGTWPVQAPDETIDCAPPFADPAVDDYRLPGSGRGVDWAPLEQHYGP